ncbi:hypothetical protein OSB04_026543 [Centaurea solstitialis]|uniref:Uncharacterized protein n=1 Tax=Centaurea solstitialis TaxID=347529 RepID=A0AA38VVR2_9ASTR|nr:hypothetical protein OSB04_026543 [Centaurea solstitialis]
MTTITVDLQIVRLCNNNEFITEVARTLLETNGVKLLYFDYNNAIFTIETTRDPEEIRGALQHTFPGTSVTVSRRINTPNSSIQHPPGFHDTARDMVEGCRGKGVAIVEYKQTTTLKMNFTNQPTTSSSATNVRDPEHGCYGHGNAAPPPQQYQAGTSGSAGPYGRYPASAPPMSKTEGEGYAYVYPPSEKKTEGGGYAYGYPASEKKTEGGGYAYGYPPSEKKTEGEGYAYGYPPSEKKTKGGGYAYGYPPSEKKTEGGGYAYGYPPSEKKTEGGGYAYGYPPSEKKTEGGGYAYGYPPSEKKTEGGGYAYGYPPSEKKTEGGGYAYGYPPSEKKTEGEGYVYGYPPSEKKTEGEGYAYPPSEKKYMEDENYSDLPNAPHLLTDLGPALSLADLALSLAEVISASIRSAIGGCLIWQAWMSIAICKKRDDVHSISGDPQNLLRSPTMTHHIHHRSSP